MASRATPLGLSNKLTCFLASVSGAAPEAIETTIALLPLGSRISLAIHGVIDTHPDKVAADRGESTDFALTAKGLAIIQDCARWKEEQDAEDRRTAPRIPRPRTPRRTPQQTPQQNQEEVDAAIHGFVNH